MKRISSFILIFWGLFTILSCQNSGVESNKKPSAVQFITKSVEHDWLEQGIDAIPNENAIFFEWFAPNDSEVNKYEIYRTDEEGQDFYLIDTVEDTFYIDYAIELNMKFYYYVLAMNYDQEKSVSSDTIHYKLLEKPTRLFPTGESVDLIPTFEWEDVNQANDYILRVARADTDQPIWLAVVLANLGSDHQQTLFNSDGSANVTMLSVNVTYQWRVDVIGPESNCGSESAWSSFFIQ